MIISVNLFVLRMVRLICGIFISCGMVEVIIKAYLIYSFLLIKAKRYGKNVFDLFGLVKWHTVMMIL